MRWPSGSRFDVLVIGSGASGLAAAVSAERAGARVALATKGSLQSCNSAKAQGGIQAAFGDDDSPEQHAEDVWRARTRRPTAASSRCSRARRRRAIHWLEELGVEFTRENGGYRLARCGGATRKRLLQVGDRTGHAITKALRDACRGLERRRRSRTRRCARSSRPRTAGARRCGDGTSSIDAGDGRPRGRRPLLPRGRGARRALDEPSRRDRRGDARSRSSSAPRRATSTRCSTTRTAAPGRRTMQGYSIPETTRAYGAVLAQRRRRGVHRLARPARRRLAGDRRRGRGRARRRDARRPPRGAASTRRGSPRPTRRSRCRTCCAATARPASTRSAEPILTYPVLHYQNGGLVIDERRRDDARRASTPAARSPAARTGATA